MPREAGQLALVVALVSCGNRANVNPIDPATEEEDSAPTADAGHADPRPTSKPPPPAAIGSTVVEVRLTNLGADSKAEVPVTFAQVFRKGDVPKSASVRGRIAGSDVPLQVDTKARYDDGSLRHAVISALIRNLVSDEEVTLELVSSASDENKDSELSRAEFLSTGVETELTLAIDGVEYTASLADLLSTGKSSTWLSGPLATEWEVSGPVMAGADEHPHLAVRYNARTYRGFASTRVEVTVENDWAFVEEPRGYTYDLSITTNGTESYNRPGLLHYDRARFRKVFWIGEAPSVEVRLDSAYLISTGVVPNYDPKLSVSESALAGFEEEWSGPITEPMGSGLLEPYMPETGGRRDIGILPNWAAIYVLTMDPRARLVTLGTGDSAGSFGIHYRDRNSDRPITIDDYPDLTILGNPSDTTHPFPSCAAECDTPYAHDSSHQPSMDFVPYLVTGDHFYLEELQFWATYNLLQHNPGYRNREEGLVKPDQTRGQAWSLRTLAQAAFITPDDDALKEYFESKLENNVNYYVDTWANGDANPLGILGDGAAFSYSGGTGIAPWQDDFFTSVVGYLVDLGYASAKPLLDWKARFPIGRINGEGYCWISGAPYSLVVRETSDDDFYEDFATLYQKNFGTLTNGDDDELGSLECASQAMADWFTQADIDDGQGRSPWVAGEMTGYAASPTGYPSNLQPALAAAADSSAEGAQRAWEIFEQRAVKPDYSSEPQFAIVPRYLNR